jgi:hypothetical protein
MSSTRPAEIDLRPQAHPARTHQRPEEPEDIDQGAVRRTWRAFCCRIFRSVVRSCILEHDIEIYSLWPLMIRTESRMRNIVFAVIILAAIGVGAAVPFATSALAAYDRPSSSASTPGSQQPSASPSWASTWGPPTNFGPGTIAPDGAPDSIPLNGAQSCPTVNGSPQYSSGNQQNGNQQNGNQQQSGPSGGGRHRHSRRNRGSGQGQGGGQQPAPTATPVPSQPSGS